MVLNRPAHQPVDQSPGHHLPEETERGQPNPSSLLSLLSSKQNATRSHLPLPDLPALHLRPPNPRPATSASTPPDLDRWRRSSLSSPSSRRPAGRRPTAPTTGTRPARPCRSTPTRSAPSTTPGEPSDPPCARMARGVGIGRIPSSDLGLVNAECHPRSSGGTVGRQYRSHGTAVDFDSVNLVTFYFPLLEIVIMLPYRFSRQQFVQAAAATTKQAS
jgi:hypothetical protein